MTKAWLLAPLLAACVSAPAPAPTPEHHDASPPEVLLPPKPGSEPETDIDEIAREIERLVMVGDCSDAVAEAEQYLRTHSADGGAQSAAERDIYESYVRCQDELGEANQ